MEEIVTAKTRTTRVLYIVLLSITCVLGILIAIGTIIGLVRNSDTPLIKLGSTEPVQTEQIYTAGDGDIRIFSGIGRLRVSLADSSVLVLSIVFPYQTQDLAFSEELAGKINDFKTIAADYFASLPESEIIQINEDAAKNEILKRYNSTLRLGQISALYFTDMMIIDSF